MKKKTHWLLTKHILEEIGNNFTNFEKFVICVGSVLPDLGIFCLIKPHCFSRADLVLLRKLNKLEKFDFKYKDCLTLGVAGHYIADYFTAPHNRNGIKNFCTNHRCYEKGLDRYFRKRISSIKSKFGVPFDNTSYFWLYIESLHSDYSNLGESYLNDFNFIVKSVSSLFTTVVLNT